MPAALAGITVAPFFHKRSRGHVRNWIILLISTAIILGVLLFVNPRSPQVEQEQLDDGSQVDPQQETIPLADEPETALVAPSFDVVRVSREGTGVIAGRAAPNAEVTIRAGDRVIGAAVANRNGEWVLIFDEPLEAGTQELSLSAVAPGEPEVQSDSVVIVSIPERDFALPSEAEGVVAILSPRHGDGPSRILQKPGMVLEDSIDRRLLVETIDYDEVGRAVFAGKTSPAAEVRLYLDNAYLGVVVGDEVGKWTFQASDPVTTGPHVLRLDQIYEGDGVEIRIEQPFDRQ
ncbi:MAG: Ig-like domain-containing protein, partial [Sphingomonadales bacterium]